MKTILKAYNDLKGQVFIPKNDIPEDFEYLVREGFLEFNSSIGNGTYYMNTIKGLKKGAELSKVTKEID